MKIERMEMDPVTVLRLEGDIDESGVSALRVGLLNCLKERRFNVVLNMSDIRLVSYMGLGVLVERLRQFRACKGDMKLVGINLSLKRMFRMAGIASLFEVYDSETQAIAVYQEAA
jgi:anti-sigma B factor antagonist